MRTQLVSVLAVLFLATACLENEEEITIRPDGSADVRLSSRGDVDDMADGYPLPLAAPWRPANEATRAWLSLVGPDTGSALVRANVAQLDRSGPLFTGAKKEEVALEVRADFRRVEDIPTTHAPAAEPYRSAFLERTTTLAVRHVGARTVYEFERRIGARAWSRYDVWTLAKATLPPEFEKRLQSKSSWTASERERLVAAAVSGFAGAARAFAEETLDELFARSQDSIPTAAASHARSEVQRRVALYANADRLKRIVDAVLPESPGAAAGPPPADVNQLEVDVRDAIRGGLEAGLVAARTSAREVNRAKRALEWRFTSYDHSGDLGDDKFVLVVHMPGTIVGGNADLTDGSTAQWTLQGEGLRDHERVLRAVSRGRVNARADFDALVATHGRDVLRVCHSILRDEHMAKDAAQETFLRLWGRVSHQRTPEKANAWLRRVALTTALDLARVRSRKPTTQIDDDNPPFTDRREETLRAIDAPLLRARFEAALNDLPESQRTIFLLRHEGGMTLPEIAESLDLALSTIKTQFARAVLKLQAKLAPFRPE